MVALPGHLLMRSSFMAVVSRPKAQMMAPGIPCLRHRWLSSETKKDPSFRSPVFSAYVIPLGIAIAISFPSLVVRVKLSPLLRRLTRSWTPSCSLPVKASPLSNSERRTFLRVISSIRDSCKNYLQQSNNSTRKIINIKSSSAQLQHRLFSKRCLPACEECECQMILVTYL